VYWKQIVSEKESLKKLPISAKAVVVSKDGRVLLMRKTSGSVDLPGGKVEDGEDLYLALEREILEETGLEITDFEFVASWVKHNPELGDRLMVVFEAYIHSKAKKIPVELSDEHGWCDFICPTIADEIGDMPPGYGNAISICYDRFLTRSKS